MDTPDALDHLPWSDSYRNIDNEPFDFFGLALADETIRSRSVHCTMSVMRPQTSEYFKKHLFLIYRSTQAVDTDIAAQSKKFKKIERVSTTRGTAPLPRALVQFASSTATPSSLTARRTKCGSREQDEVSLALCPQVVRLLRCRDHSHSAHDDVDMRLLDRLRKRNQRTV